MKARIFTLLLLFSLFTAKLHSQVNHWAYMFGGPSTDETMDVCKDGSGNIISTGYFTNTIHVSGNTISSASMGIPDIFICKTDNTGNVIWLKRAGGSGSDRPYSVCADAAGNVYITGSFYGSAHFGSTTLISVSATQDMFVAKLDPNGNFLWAKSAGGGENDIGNAITVDNSGNVYVTGAFQSNALFGTTALTSMNNPVSGQASFDVFVAKYDGNGNLAWVRQGAASLDDRGLGIGCDNGGNVYVCGQFSDTITFQSAHVNQVQNAIFLVKFDTNGQEQWFRRAGATYSIANDLVIDNSNNIYFTGDCQGNMCFYGLPNHFMNHPLLYRAYIAKYSSGGNFIWAKCDGSINEVSSRSIALDPAQNPYMYGEFKCRFTDYSNAFGQAAFNSVGYRDLFVCKYDAAGNRQWFRHAGGKRNDLAHGLVLLENDEPVMAGSYEYNLNVPVSGPVSYHNTVGSMTGCNGPYCGDAEYGQFLSFNYLGYLDGFLFKILNPTRQPYDPYVRSGSACNRDTLTMCIGSSCQDTIPLCVKGYIAPNTRQCTGLGPNYLYSWNGMPYDTVSHPLISSPGYQRVKIKTIDGCSSDEDTVYVKINPLPAIPLISDDKLVNIAGLSTQSVIVCHPDSVRLWTTNAGSNSVTWKLAPPMGMVYHDSAYVKIYSGRDTVIFTSPDGCIRKNQVYVKVDYPPMNLHLYSAMPDSFVICEGDHFSYPLLDSVISPSTCLKLTNLVWSSNPPLLIGTDNYYDSTYASYCHAGGDITADSTANYTISLAAIYNNSCGSDTFYFHKTIYVKVNPKPGVYVSHTGSTQLCEGDSIQITYIPVITNCNNCQLQYTDSLHPWYGNYGDYYYSVTATDTSTGCTNLMFDHVLIDSKPEPYLVISPANGIICPNDSVKITCQNNGLNLVQYTWFGPLGMLPNTSPFIYSTVAGNYFCIVKDADSCVFTTNPVEIKQYNTPYLLSLQGDAICNGQPVTLKVVSNDSTLIQWLAPFSGGGTTRVATTAGTYSCTVTMCGITTTCVIVIASSNPSVSITAAGSTTICPGDSVVLQGSGGLYNYQWQPVNDTTQNLVVYTSGSYSLKVIDPVGCTAISQVIDVFLNTSVTQPVVADDTICYAQPFSLSAVSAFQLEWYTDSVGGTMIAGGPVFNGPALMHDTVFYVCSYDPSVSCRSTRIPVHVLISPYSFAPIVTGDTVSCSGSSVSLVASGYPAGAVLHWGGPGGFSSSADTVNISHVTVLQQGLYWVYLSGGACASDTVWHSLLVHQIQVNLGPDTVLCSGDVLTLHAGNHPGVWWQDGSQNESYVVQNDQNGSYSVTVGDSVGCQASDSIQVSFVTCNDTIPNIFTPNGDGVNDVFNLKIYSGNQYRMQVFDRWGSVIALLDPEHPTWDGRSSKTGIMLHEGTYFYVLEMNDKHSGERKALKGFVTLQR